MGTSQADSDGDSHRKSGVIANDFWQLNKTSDLLSILVAPLIIPRVGMNMGLVILDLTGNIACGSPDSIKDNVGKPAE